MNQPLDVWLRFVGDDEESDAEANTYRTREGYEVRWYLTAVGLVTTAKFATLTEAHHWLESEGFGNYSS